MVSNHVTISITPLQAERMARQLQQTGDCQLQFREKGMKGGFWGAIASTLLPMAAPLIAQGVGALVKKISGNGHGAIPITCTKIQMNKIKQCGAGLKLNFKIRSPGRNPSPGVARAMHSLQGSGWLSNVLPMILKVARPMGKAIGRAAVSGVKSLLKAGVKHGIGVAADKAGHWGTDLIEQRFMPKKQQQQPLDLSLFPNVPQDGNGLQLSGQGLQLSGRGRSAARSKKNVIANPTRFVIKRV